MKKRLRTKLTASVLVVMMLVLSLSTMMVSATSTNARATVTIQNTPATTGATIMGKTFDLYRVFDLEIVDGYTNDDGAEVSESVDYHVNDDFYGFFDSVLEDVKSSDIMDDADSEAYDFAALEYVNAFKVINENGDVTTNDMASLVTALRKYVLENTIVPTTTAAVSNISSGVEHVTSESVVDGYYLVLDSSAIVENGGIMATGSLVTVPGRATDGTLSADVTITMKGSLPTINKEVWHDDLTNKNGDVSPLVDTSGSWDTVADYEIGDTIEYRITATIPSDLRGYTEDSYTYIISDTLSEGLSLDSTSIEIYTDPSLSDESKVEGAYHAIETDGTSMFKITFEMVNIKNNPALTNITKFYVYYNAEVTDDAKVAPEYETNTVKLEYSNNPYEESTGEIEDIVYSYTFDLDIFKTAGDGVTGLAGAIFALYEVASEGADPVQVYLEQDTSVTSEVKTYYPSSGVANSTSGVVVTPDLGDDGYVTGKFTIIGLNDEVAYVLKEISAPVGYNAVDPMYFTIHADYDEVAGVPKPKLSVTQTDASFLVTTSGLSGIVINTSSTLLPTTGGMGTTIFMIVGGIMMFGAVTLLVVKRKRG